MDSLREGNSVELGQVQELHKTLQKREVGQLGQSFFTFDKTTAHMDFRDDGSPWGRLFVIPSRRLEISIVHGKSRDSDPSV